MTETSSPFARVARGAVILVVFAVLAFALPIGLSLVKAGAYLKQMGIPHYTNLFAFIIAGTVLTIVAVMVLRRIWLPTALGELGLLSPFSMPLLAGLLAVATMAVVARLMGRTYQPQDVVSLVALGVVSPIGEEILFRGFVFRQLRRWAEAPFWPAALIASLLFAAGHWSQGDTLVSSLEASGITFAGGMLFCWAAERWNSIWFGIIVHMGLNCVWQMFALGDNAIGDSIANIARTTAIVVTIVATMLLTSRRSRAMT